MARVALILFGVAAVLPLEVDFVLFHVCGEDIVGAHAEHLREADEKMEQVDNLDAGVLLVEFLVLGPPFPRNAVGQFGDFLAHGAAVVEYPLGFLLAAHPVCLHADPLIERLLHPKEFS